MQAYGSDRARSSAGKIILHSRISKGWTAGTPKCPGTAVQWGEECFEVLSAELLPEGGVRYVLGPWSDSATIRLFYVYDEASEVRLAADDELARKQRRHSRFAGLTGVLLGHLPHHVQNHLSNELGVFPARMTLLSTIPSLVLLGSCLWFHVQSRLDQAPSPIPAWLWLVAFVMLFDSGVRFQVAMAQSRGIGSLPGTLLYGLYRLFSRKPGAKKLSSSFMIPASPEVAAADALEMRAAFLTLLSKEEQALLAQRYGFEFRRHAAPVAWTLLGGGALGIVSMTQKALDGELGSLLSLGAALFVAIEQLVRLRAFSRGPAGSVFGIVVRPFTRDLLR